jgi:hypothetical protein
MSEHEDQGLEQFLEMEPPNGLTHAGWAQAMAQYLDRWEAEKIDRTVRELQAETDWDAIAAGIHAANEADLGLD